MVGLWVAGLASFSLPHFPVLKRRKATRLRQGIIRTADHKSLYDKELNLDRDEGGDHHHKDKKHNFSFGELASGGSSGLCHPFAFSPISVNADSFVAGSLLVSA
jgi:hypothetical protein